MDRRDVRRGGAGAGGWSRRRRRRPAPTRSRSATTRRRGAAAPLDGLSFPSFGTYVYGGVYGASAASAATAATSTRRSTASRATARATSRRGSSSRRRRRRSRRHGRPRLLRGPERAVRLAGRHALRDPGERAAGDARRVLAGVRLQRGGDRSVDGDRGREPARGSAASRRSRDRGHRGLRRRPDVRAGGVAGAAPCPELGGDPCMAANHLYAMLVTLEDDSAPAAGTVSGPLVTPGVLAGWAAPRSTRPTPGRGSTRASHRRRRADRRAVGMGANGGRCVTLAGGARPLRFDWTVPCPLAAAARSRSTRARSRRAARRARSCHRRGRQRVDGWSGDDPHRQRAAGRDPADRAASRRSGQTLVAANGSWSPARDRVLLPVAALQRRRARLRADPGRDVASYAVGAADAYGSSRWP